MDSFSEFRDWANLPLEMVELISKKVKYIVDYIRFRAVCSTWRSVPCPKQHRLPPQLPWLMLPYDGSIYKNNDEVHFFYDVWESKMRKLYFLADTCCASYHGWLLLVSYKGRDVSLLNPLTQSEIKLPAFGTWFDPYYISFGKSKMTFSADLTHPNCLITVFLEKYWVISCQIGDRSWKRYYPRKELVDATHYNGRLYFLYEGEMMIIESNKREERRVLVPELTMTIVLEPELTAVKKRFVEGKSGVYVVGVHHERKFVLYEFLEQQMMLRKITTDTSDSTVIFYGDNYPCLALSSDDWDTLDGGSLYLEHKCVPDELKLEAVEAGYNIYSAQIVDGNVIFMSHKDQKPPYYQAKPAMWFQPSFF
ncbi:F-box protein skip23 [Rhynchospora pubera]|uniref:F-box protein skip23 n=1 Tax=Rhynchospora pubera TaxID=906938 RepID=A0AAV8EJX6_9POAL|nr:F-box protein skip23 [Rhynchospora pubera]